MILLLVGAIAVYVAFFAMWAPLIFILKVKRKWRATFIAAPLVGLLYLGGVAGLFWHSTRPGEVYKNTFGVHPSADVSDLKSRLYYFADTGEVFLQFKCNKATLDSLIASKGMAIDPAPKSVWDETPQWWLPGLGADWSECYSTENSTKGFAQEEAVLIYNPNTKQANYYWRGID